MERVPENPQGRYPHGGNQFSHTGMIHQGIWDGHDAAVLDRYLVSGVEDPRINATSIVERGLIADRLFGSMFHGLTRCELHAGAMCCWLQARMDMGMTKMEILDAIDRGDPQIPSCLADIHRSSKDCGLPEWMPSLACCEVGGDHRDAMSWFEERWRRGLAAVHPQTRLAVTECACGSANEYRIWDVYGLARHIAYRGSDVSHKNIDNSRRHFPDTSFDCLDMLASGLPSHSADIVIANDVIEHLPPDEVPCALREMARIARSEVWIGCFQMTPDADIIVRSSAGYHCNTLGFAWLCAACPELSMEWIGISELIAHGLPGLGYHNPLAGIVMVANPAMATMMPE